MNTSPLKTRRTFLKTLGVAAAAAPNVTSGLLARSPGGLLRHASFGAGGMALGDLTVIGNWKGVELAAICDVDLRRTAEARELFPNAKVYQDWRELLDKEGAGLDSVNVSTPDHMHAPIAMASMQLGKHVYCQKPLAHDLFEVRQLARMARKKKVVTQMGIQIHSAAPYRVAVHLIQSGVIGKIREIHSWCPTSWGDPAPRPHRVDSVPADFAWDLWLGVCGERPFLGDGYYHPGNWRRRLDFGAGTLGDMGCHLFDPIFTALGVLSLISVRSEGPGANEWNWPVDAKVCFEFAGTERTAGDTLPITWYDGASKPGRDVVNQIEGAEMPDTGSILIGTEGTMLLPHFSQPSLYPTARFAGFAMPNLGDGNHWGEFVNACRGEGKTSTDFAYSAPLTEAVLAGCVALRLPAKTLKWNSRKLRFDLKEANAFIRREYREGWSVKGLS